MPPPLLLIIFIVSICKQGHDEQSFDRSRLNMEIPKQEHCVGIQEMFSVSTIEQLRVYIRNILLFPICLQLSNNDCIILSGQTILYKNKIANMNKPTPSSRDQLIQTQDSVIKQSSSSKNEDNINVFKSAPQSGRPLVRPKSKLLCTICMSEKVGGKFAKCQHEVICLKCAESHLMSSLQMEKVPKCPLNCCQAKLSTDSDSMFAKFSTRARMQWKAFHLKSQVQHLGPTFKCQKADCPGYLDPIASTCQICESPHCQKCHRSAHPGECLGVSDNIANLQNLKFCKFCAAKVIKFEGCPKIRCQTCKRAICYECLDEWSFQHHGCEEFGWLKLPINVLWELCCSNDTVDKSQQLTFQAKQR